MTPKEKAIELYKMFEKIIDSLNNGFSNHEEIKQCALITVDEILKSNPCFENSDRGGNLMYSNNSYYWQEVKEEINKL